MLGGIIGDLAASTYLRDPNCFYRQLIDDKATLSEYGLSVIATYAYLKSDIGLEKERGRIFIKKFFEKFDYHSVKLSEYANAWVYDMAFRSNPCTAGMLLNRIAVNGFLNEENENTGWSVMIDESLDKEEGYARIVLSEMIRLLRHGKSKNEVYEEINPVFKSVRHNWDWKEQSTTLCLLMRAWDCFYNSHDFGSAIHNAVRYPNSFTRQIASLVGLIGEAMYGCEYYFIKKKFAHNGETSRFIELPNLVENSYHEQLESIRKDYRENRLFFRKNDALTNVEQHTFIPCTSHYEGLTLSPYSYRKVIYAFDTDWDNRYGFYLDNGWIYCYRSGYNLGRFRFIMQDKRYVVTDVQQTGDLPNGINLEQGLVGAFHSCRIPEVS